MLQGGMAPSRLDFRIDAQASGSRARAATFRTLHGPVLTDSGGYQIFSLPHSREVTEEAALFQSYVDGRTVRLSPELSIETQVAIGSDIMMVLDQCVSAVADRATARAALDLTHCWAARSLAARGESPQSLFGIVQGADAVGDVGNDLERPPQRLQTSGSA